MSSKVIIFVDAILGSNVYWERKLFPNCWCGCCVGVFFSSLPSRHSHQLFFSFIPSLWTRYLIIIIQSIFVYELHSWWGIQCGGSDWKKKKVIKFCFVWWLYRCNTPRKIMLTCHSSYKVQKVSIPEKQYKFKNALNNTASKPFILVR